MAAAIPLLLILSIVSFTMIRALPGDPVEAIMGESIRDISAQDLSYLRKELGLDDPMPAQYLHWLGGWVGQGELGRSYHDDRPVLEVIFERVPATILLVGLAITLAFSSGLIWGVFLVWIKVNSKFAWLEGLLVSTTLLIYSVPAFLTGLLAIYLVTYISALHFIPVFRVVNIKAQEELIGLLPFAILPALCLALGRAAKVSLFVRSLALDEVNKGYVTMALAKGLPYFKVILFHVVRNCMIPVINLLALALPALCGGSILIETIFGWPGTGRLAVDATFGRNYPVMTCLVMLYGTMVILSNMLADMISPAIDPRLKDTLESSAKQEAVRTRQL